MSSMKISRPSVVEKALEEMKKEEIDNFTFRIPRELKDRLFENARKNRTQASYIALDLIKQYLNDQER